MLMLREQVGDANRGLRVTLSPVALPIDGHDLLAEMASEPNPFLERWFLEPALACFTGDREVMIAEARDEHGFLLGLIPLTIGEQYGRMRVRHTTNWTHYQCFMGAPLLAEGYETQFWEALIKALDESEWAAGFLTVTGLIENSMNHLSLNLSARTLGRDAPIVHGQTRAMLKNEADPETYLGESLRGKKRKELRRQANRLRDMGTLAFRTLGDESELPEWTDSFLALEAAGWKGARGAAFANEVGTERFLRTALAGSLAAGRLDFQRLDLNGHAIAMLVNFRTPPGSWSFKIAYDEALAQYSPGVLIELENLKQVLGDGAVDWMDSCASENHPMIDRLWMERRRIVQVTVPLSGLRRRTVHGVCRSAERGALQFRKMIGKPAW